MVLFNYRYSKEEEEKLEGLYGQHGNDFNLIAEKMGRTPVSVRKWLQKKNVHWQRTVNKHVGEYQVLLKGCHCLLW